MTTTMTIPLTEILKQAHAHQEKALDNQMADAFAAQQAAANAEHEQWMKFCEEKRKKNSAKIDRKKERNQLVKAHNDKLNQLYKDPAAARDLSTLYNKLAQRSIFMTDDELIAEYQKDTDYLFRKYGIPKVPIETDEDRREIIRECRQSFPAVMAARRILYDGAPGKMTEDALRELPPQTKDVIRFNTYCDGYSVGEDREIDAAQVGKFGILDLDLKYVEPTEAEAQKMIDSYAEIVRLSHRSFITSGSPTKNRTR